MLMNIDPVIYFAIFASVYMKKIKKYNLISALMIVSQMMLLIFVISWLISQYNDEKDNLKEQLKTFYLESKSQVLDSLLLEHVISPSISFTGKECDAISESSSYSFITSDRFHNDSATQFLVDHDSLESAIITIAYADSTRHQNDSITTTLDFQEGLDDMLVRSVKLFIHQKEGLNQHSQNLYFAGMIDTVLFKRVYRNKIADKKWNFMVDWPVQAEIDSNLSKVKNIIVFKDDNELFPPVQVRKYRTYLITAISPQIAFALILLLLTASAFYIAHKSLRKQRVLNQTRNDFVSNITHELKTPVSTVKVALEALQKYDMKKDPEVANQYLKMSYLEMDRLDNLIAKVLGHSMLEDNGELISKEEFNLVSFVNDILQNLHPRFINEKARVNFTTSEERIIVKADKLFSQGIIINLIDNSLKYCDKNPEIEISIKTQRDFVYLIVKDNGPGIPDEYLKKVFDKFFRVPGNNTHNVKGYGLGLSFAALVMEQHKGSIQVKNLPEGGCSFELKFPKESL